MAQITSIANKDLKVFIDAVGTTFGVGTRVIGLTGKTFTISTESVDTTVPDDADEDLVVAITRAPSTRSFSLSGTGVMAADRIDEVRAMSGVVVNARFQFDVNLAGGGGYWQGRAILSEFEITSERANRAGFSATWVSAGDWVWTAAAA